MDNELTPHSPTNKPTAAAATPADVKANTLIIVADAITKLATSEQLFKLITKIIMQQR